MRASLIIIIFLSLISCKETKVTEYQIDEDIATVTIAPDADLTMIMDIRSIFKEQKNIDISFTGTKFSKEGKLTLLRMKIDCNDGFTGEIEANYDKKSGNQGFIRRYNSKRRPFKFGKMK